MYDEHQVQRILNSTSNLSFLDLNCTLQLLINSLLTVLAMSADDFADDAIKAIKLSGEGAVVV